VVTELRTQGVAAIGVQMDYVTSHLVKHSKLTFTLDNLPASAAKILRDAGHGV